MPERYHSPESHSQPSTSGLKRTSSLKRIIEGVIVTLLTGLLVGVSVSIVKKPQVKISIDPPNPKVLRGDKVRVSWRVDNADDIELRVGTEKIRVEREGSRSATIEGPTTFSITATSGWLKFIFAGADFFCTAVKEIPLEILPPPTVKVWAEPAEVFIGEYTTINWSTNDADRVFIKGIESGRLPVDRHGFRQVKIEKTKTFQIVGSNRAGETTAPFTVHARIPEPKASISADNIEIPVGNNAMISWTSENADSVVLKGVEAEPITVESSGSRQVQINASKTFEIVASNQIGKARESVTVNVYVPELNVSLSVDPKTIVMGGYATLSWDSENAQTVVIDGFGEIPAKGSRQIQVVSSKTYEVVATSSEGTKRATATVNVRPPRAALIGVGDISEPIKQTINPALESFFRAKGYEIAYNARVDRLSNNTNVDYIVQYQVSPPEWKSSHIRSPFGSFDQHTVEVRITLSLISNTARTQLPSVEGRGTSSIRGLRTQYGEFSRNTTSAGKEIEATRKAVSEALKRSTF